MEDFTDRPPKTPAIEEILNNHLTIEGSIEYMQTAKT